jgi:alkanesulfonate monooxygenase SsuD/methylene tetrahydromethanopterin reductase-like flavin-dependent oxidoreductase (luciferase family)
MKYGFVVPFADAREFAGVAKLGEQHGWDGIFTWENLYGVDAWVTLGAAAMVTERIRLGTLLTPASRHRPWDLASDVGTVDRLSRGRVVMGVGLGALHGGWTRFEADEGRRVRAQRLDESLSVLAGLLGSEDPASFSFNGSHYPVRVEGADAPPGPPPPAQRPHPPVWVVGAYRPGAPRQPSLERAARWQGLLPTVIDPDAEEGKPSYDLTSFAEVVARVRGLREDAGLPWEGYDVVVEADSTGEFIQLEGTPSDWERAGGTWWVESWWSLEPGEQGLAEVRRQVETGPSRDHPPDVPAKAIRSGGSAP